MSTYSMPSNFMFLEKTFERLAKDGDKCEVFGGALRDQLLNVKESDIDIRITERLYRDFKHEMNKTFRLVSETTTFKSDNCNYSHCVLVINAPNMETLILDISFFDKEREHDENIDFTVNNLKQSLIGPDKGKLLVRGFPRWYKTMSYTEWLLSCIRDVFACKLVCMYDMVSEFCPREFVIWNEEKFEYRLKRLEKMKSKEAFKHASVEYLTEFRFDKNIVFGSVKQEDIIKEDKCPICMVKWDNIPSRIVSFNCRHTFCTKCLCAYFETIHEAKCAICKQEI